ncbi:hypothetical protein [Methylocystis sp. S23]
MMPFPHIIGAGSRGLTFVPDDIVYSSAMYGRGFSRISRGGLTNAGGGLQPSVWGGMQIDALLQATGPNGDLVVAIVGLALPRDVFHSVIVPGLNSGARFVATASNFFYPVGTGYNVTVWQWSGVAGVIAGGDVMFE